MKLARTGLAVTVVSFLLLAGVYVRALGFTPVERSQGAAQKIFYIHVPAAVWTELAVILVGIAGIFYLFLRDPRLDRFAEASAEAGVAFGAVVLTTGPIWGKPVWGTWWAWEPRLTLFLLLFLLLVGYLILRGAVMDPGLRPRFAAVLGICGMVLVPFVHLSVYMFRGLHPKPIVLQPGPPQLPPEMLVTLLFSFGVFSLLYVGFVTQRIALARLREERGHVAS